MKFSRLTAAILTVTTAIAPISLNRPVLLNASTVFAKETDAVAALPDWIPDDFDSAVEFRNTYGATHIDNGLICIVCPDRARKGASEDTYGFELRATEGMGQELKHGIYTYEYTETCFDVFVYQPLKQGDIVLTVADPHVQVKPSEKETGDNWEPPAIAEYTFTLDKSLNITETDIFSWLPDSKTEYNEYTKLNGEVSVKDNYLVFCTMAVAQLGDKWEPASTNKYENIKNLLSSDCTMQVPDLYDDGSVDKIYVYQAVKDGYEKISWTRTSSARPNPEEQTTYTLTADCVVLDDAQTILLPGQMRATLVDFDSGEQIILSEEQTPYIWTNISNGESSTGPILVMETNPAIVSDDLGVFSDSKNFSFGLEERGLPDGYSFIDDEKRPGYYSGTILPENCMTVTRYDNGSADIIFKLKFNPTGDINNDGEFNVADVVLLQKWLLAVPDTHLANWETADFCRDNNLDIFDLVLMRKALLKSINLPVEVSVRESGGVVGAMIIYKVYCEGENYFLSYQDLTYDQNPKHMVYKISEQEYREIMAMDYDSMIRNMNNHDGPEWSEIEFVLEVSYSDGSQKKAVSDRTPSVITKLRNLKEKYSNYVKPDEHFEYGISFYVQEDGLKLYLGPDESYSTVASIPANTRLFEKGIKKDNNEWLFTEYNGQYGWINTIGADGKPVIFFDGAAKKPVIYLYPEEETDVHVELELTEADLSTTYPRYNNGWNVTASPDGSLLNKADGTHHKYLFWDAVNCRTRFDFSEGFCVAGSDTEGFLKEKLSYMGLTEEEMNEFIVYWLPLMEHNRYNLISFQGDVYTDSAKLNITPKPDSLLRIFMAYVPLEEAVDIEPQQLDTFERKGFAVVEWGGSEIKS